MRRILCLVVAVSVILLFLVSFLLLRQDNKIEPDTTGGNSEFSTYKDSEHGISLSYPKQATVGELSSQEKTDKKILRANYDKNPPYLITLRYEDGLNKATQLAKTSTLDLLLANIAKAFPDYYDNFKQLSQNRYELRGHQAADVVFTYVGPSGKPVKQQLTILVKDPDTAFFLAQQATESDFATLKDIFQQVSRSITFK